MAKIKHFQKYGLNAYASTKTEAMAQIDAMVSDIIKDHTPVIIALPGHAQCALVFRSRECWAYQRVDSLEDLALSCAPTCVGMASREDAIKSARRHLAQVEYMPETDGNTTTRTTGEEWIQDERDKRDHLGWCNWQDRYAYARRALGMEDEPARQYASSGPVAA